MLPGGKCEKDEKKCLTFLRLAYIICDVAGDNATIDVCLAQLDRAFGYGPKGRGFESSNTRNKKGNLSFEVSFFYASVKSIQQIVVLFVRNLDNKTRICYN